MNCPPKFFPPKIRIKTARHSIKFRKVLRDHESACKYDFRPEKFYQSRPKYYLPRQTVRQANTNENREKKLSEVRPPTRKFFCLLQKILPPTFRDNKSKPAAEVFRKIFRVQSPCQKNLRP